jgi:hypothetical protein
MKKFLILLLLTISSANAAPMKTWNCEAKLDSYMSDRVGYSSFLQEEGSDYAWWTLREGVEDAFDDIANNAWEIPCQFDKIVSEYKTEQKKLPNSLLWYGYVTWETTLGVQVIRGTKEVVKENPSKENISEYREAFKSFGGLMPVCTEDGVCSTAVLCAYSCNYGE